MGKEDFYKDLEVAKEVYPFIEDESSQFRDYPFKIVNDFEVSDHEGNHWGTFRASVCFPKTYPKGFPVMQDLSKEFPWEDDWHISPSSGECCVCGVIEKEEEAQRGITILEFVKNYVLQFYANQIYRKEFGYYKNGEYSHYIEGVWESLEEEFMTKDRLKIKNYLLEMKNKRGRNEVCFCGSGRKYKKCHLPRIKIIESVVNNFF